MHLRGIWINDTLWRRLPKRVRVVVLACLLSAEEEDGVLSFKAEDLEWLPEREREWALSWLSTARMSHYCNFRHYLNPTVAHIARREEARLFEKWSKLVSTPF